MSDSNSNRPWDEHDWERFLQEQDHKTEQYMELLEKYMDHPERDQIIAKEMGWTHLTDDTGLDWTEEAAAFFDDIDLEEIEKEAAEFETEDTFEKHPLYRASFTLTVAVDQMFDDLPQLQNHPLAVKLATNSAIGSAKLAAALSDDDIDEMGMTIAYLKRALKAITNALEAVTEMDRAKLIGRAKARQLSQRIFKIRDGIISEMGRMRAEWRRRYGD